MSPLLKSRLLLATAVVAVIIVAAVAFFYRPTRLALERAESLQFQRMQVSRLADESGYRFFFITNRGQSTGTGEPLKDLVSNERVDSLQFGLFDTRIELSMGLVKLINPTDWFQNEEIQLNNVEFLSQETFVKQLRDQVDRSPYRSILIKINGFRERFPSALRKTAFLSYVLDIDSPVVVFDWPGDQGVNPMGYRRAQNVANASGAQLAQAIRIIIEQVEPDKIWLVANSMGAQVVVTTFSALYRDRDLADISKKIESVVLTAPDVDKGQFNDQFKKETAALSNNLIVYVSSNDRALLMSRILNRSRRLGESTLNIVNPDQTQEAAELFDLVTPDEQLVTLVDVTPINRTRNFHNFSLETPEFFDDLYLRLVNDGIMPHSRPEHEVKGADGRSYRILTRGQ
jgi:esterase/lipase superfamily enzyme